MKAIYLVLVLLVASPLWSQVEPSTTGGNVAPDDESRMQIPAPVSVQGYPTLVGSQERANYLLGGLVFTSAYDDNVVPGYSPVPVSDYSYFIWPTISLQQQTSRMMRSFTYSPGFRFYQRVTSLNAVNQGANADFQYRLSPRATIAAHDSFSQNSNVFNQPYTVAGGVSGSTQNAGSFVIAPYADQLSNTARAVFTYQFALNGMVGGGGSTAVLNYPNSSQVPGLANFRSEGAQGFYSRRLSRGQYLGGVYQYSHLVTHPVVSTTQTQSVLLFYTVDWNRKLTISLTAGPQNYRVEQPSVPTSTEWSPGVWASLGWHANRTNFAVSYSRSVSAGGGLVGAYNSNSASTNASWEMAPRWTLDVHGSYVISKNAVPQSTFSYPGGHTIVGGASFGHQFGQYLRAELGYDRLHQSYNGVSLVTNAPDSNRGYVSITYQFIRPLGR